MNTVQLNNTREKIDTVDTLILSLLSERSMLALEALSHKKGQAIYATQREQNILQRLSALNGSPLSQGAIEKIFSTIIGECRYLQQRVSTLDKQVVKISIQGIAGSFCQQAAWLYCQQKGLLRPDLVYSINSAQALHCVLVGESELAVMALNNSYGGLVDETITALADAKYHIVDTVNLAVSQNLLANIDTTSDQIRHIYSHPQALKQCRQYLSLHYPEATRHPSEDTASAARALSLGQYPTNSAVIAAKDCIKHYNLQILDSNIQDQIDNSTLFVVLSKQEQP